MFARVKNSAARDDGRGEVELKTHFFFPTLPSTAIDLSLPAGIEAREIDLNSLGYFYKSPIAAVITWATR